MDLIALAVPFFLVALIIELFVDWRRRTGFYRSNDAINSISAGMLDGFNGNMALLRTKLRQWDGDLDVRDVTPGVNNV